MRKRQRGILAQGLEHGGEVGLEELDFEKQRVKVAVSIFGRATPVELSFEEVELAE